jgi:hypothetical protein
LRSTRVDQSELCSFSERRRAENIEDFEQIVVLILVVPFERRFVQPCRFVEAKETAVGHEDERGGHLRMASVSVRLLDHILLKGPLRRLCFDNPATVRHDLPDVVRPSNKRRIFLGVLPS